MDIYTQVGFYTTEFEAKLAESILDEGDIRSFVQTPDVYPPGDLRSGIKLFVNPEDADRAKLLLAELEIDLELDRAKSYDEENESVMDDESDQE